jgi:DNA-binding Lrp family transcriptional regulator
MPPPTTRRGRRPARQPASPDRADAASPAPAAPAAGAPAPFPPERSASLVERERRRAPHTALSPVDLAIVRALQANGRLPSNEIARALGIPDKAVRARIRDLEESGAIRIVGRPNPFHFGFTFDAVLALNVEFGALPRVGVHVTSLPEIIVSGAVLGRYDLFAFTVLRSRSELSELLGRLAEVPGIRSCETFMVLRSSKATLGRIGVDDGQNLGTFRPASTENPVVLDALDRQICAQLLQAGRISSAEIARQLGAAQATVHRKLRRLLDQDTIRVDVQPNHPVFGFEVEAVIGIRAQIDQVAQVSQKLAQHPAVIALLRVLGQYHLVAWVVVANADDLRAFLDVDLPQVQGVEAVEPLAWLEIHKRLPGRLS